MVQACLCYGVACTLPLIVPSLITFSYICFALKDDFRERPRYPSSPYSDDNYEPVPGEVGGAEVINRRRCLSGRKVEELYDVDDEVSFC